MKRITQTKFSSIRNLLASFNQSSKKSDPDTPPFNLNFLRNSNLWDVKSLKNKFFQKFQDHQREESYRKQNFKYFYSTISEGLNYQKLYSLFGLLTIMIYKKLSCYPASDKELDKVRSNLENQIKSLEFKYQGKLRRQPVK